MPLPIAGTTTAAKIATLSPKAAAIARVASYVGSAAGQAAGQFAIGGFSQQGVRGIMASAPNVKAGLYQFGGGMGGTIQTPGMQAQFASPIDPLKVAQILALGFALRELKKTGKKTQQTAAKLNNLGKQIRAYTRDDGTKVRSHTRR